jgi:hypothetical protein
MPNVGRANSAQQQQFQAAEAYRDGLAQDRDNAARRVEELRTLQVSADRKEELAKDFTTRRSELMKSFDELCPIHDQAVGEYRTLQSDRSINDALGAYGRSTRVTVRLGPSPSFQKAFTRIKEVAQQYSLETAAPKKKSRSSTR